MRIKIEKGCVVRADVIVSPGECLDVPEDEGKILVSKGVASVVEEQPVESAETAEAAEAAEEAEVSEAAEEQPEASKKKGKK